MTLVDVEAPQQVRRNQWGQYLVVPPKGKKAVGYQRATTLAKMLEDTSNLTAWACRMTLLGAASRADIVASAQTTDPDDRKALNALVEKAKEIGGANVRRELGTALHKMVELSHADPTYSVPDAYAADVAAINAAIDAAGFDVVPEFSERILVCDSIRVAGMCDLVLRRRSDGSLYLGDLKTGSSVKYGALGWATQLSIYSQADAIYEQGPANDGSEDRRIDAPGVSQTEAYIIHCEPQSGVAELHRLTIGAEFVDLAVAVREVRKRRDLLVPHEIEGGGTDATTEAGTASPAAGVDVVGTVDDPTTATAPVTDAGEAHAPPSASSDGPSPASAILHEARTAWLIRRTEHLVATLSKRHVAEVWPTDLPRPGDIKDGARWSHSDIGTIARCLDALEAKHDVPFGDEDPKVTDERRKATEASLRAEAARMADNDRYQLVKSAPKGSKRKATAEQVKTLGDIVTAMANGTPDERARIQRVQLWQRHGSERGVPWRLGDHDPVPFRIWAVATAAVGCAELIDLGAADPDGPVRDLLSVVLEDHDLAQQPAHDVGALIGLLTTEQALRLAEMAETATQATDKDKPS